MSAAVYAEYNIDRDAMKEGRVILRHTSSHLAQRRSGWMGMGRAAVSAE